MTPEDLVTIHRIEQLKHRYLRTLDEKDWAGFRSVFAEDATADYGEGLVFDGVDAIIEFMEANLGPSMITLHQVHQPEITLDGDEAEGIWYLQDRVIMVEHRILLEGAAFYRDRYRSIGDEWLVTHTGYVRQYEHTISLDDLPSFRLAANRFG